MLALLDCPIGEVGLVPTLAVTAVRHAARRGQGAPQAPSAASSPWTAPQPAWHHAAAAITPRIPSPERAKI
ncbi:MAG TPA: hypothetical protein VM820_20665, partial [Vicinamibacterales bacterium]|nr:hypothetical protein [Vicinamibacterales bacterium]